MKEEYASNWSSKKLLGIASIFVVIVITLALALNSVVGGITALILINRVAVLQILALFIFAVFLQFALASKKLEAYQQKSLLLIVFAIILLASYKSGSLFMKYKSSSNPDYVVLHGQPIEQTNINILYKSNEGLLAIERPSGFPVFFSWHEIKQIKLSELRGMEVRKEQSQLGVLPPEGFLEEFLGNLAAFWHAVKGSAPSPQASSSVLERQ